ncbi:MAG: YggU family protein [Rhodospirillales bacterium]|nr:YggU family protein [Rhodospirillales bacterium]
MSDGARRLSPTDGGLLVRIDVRPKAARNRWLGISPGGAAFKVQIAAQPERGKANAELVSFLAELWGVAKSRLDVVRGETARSKTILVQGDAATLTSSIETLETSRD